MRLRRLIYGVLGVGMAIAIGTIQPIATTGAHLPTAFPDWSVVLPVAQALTDASATLVSIRREGGRCIQPGCASEVVIFADGTYRYTTYPSAPVTGSLSETELASLRERMAQTDLATIRSLGAPVNGSVYPLCQVAVDGREAVYTLYRNGQVEELRGCDTQIDMAHPLIQQLERLYESISTQANQAPVEPSAQEPRPTPRQRGRLPRPIRESVQRSFQRDYQNRLDNIRILRTERATWQDCLPDLPEGRFSYAPCEPQPRQGWRVEVSGEFPSLQQRIARVYYADRQPWAVMDAAASLTEEERSHLATTLQLPPSQVQISAVQEISFLPATACPDQGFCPVAPLALAWRVLVAGNGGELIVPISTLGEPIDVEQAFAYFGEGDRPTLGTLPVALANAVVRDAWERLTTTELLPADSESVGEVEFGVESIEPVTWNECRGGTGPTQPFRGICPDVTRSGWRMVVAGGTAQNPFRLVYYVPEGTEPQGWNPQPDGRQSIPEAVQQRVLAAAAEQAGVPTSSLYLHWVEARLFDRCLDTAEEAISCGTDIRPGWQVQFLGGRTQESGDWGEPLWTFHTNLTGTDVRLVSQGQWAPPP